MLSADLVFAVEFESEQSGGVMVAEPPRQQRATQSSKTGTSLVGSPFIGAATSVESRVAGMTISVIVGTSVGEIVGTIAVDGRRGRDGHRYHFKGAVNARGLFVWHGNTESGRKAVFTGTVGPDGNTLSGKYMSQEPGSLLDVGTFLASRS